MESSYKYFKNTACEYFPCHKMKQAANFNCLFCYCPMNPYKDCLGTPVYITCEDGQSIKDCSNCIYPHIPENYERIMQYLKEKSRL